MANKGISQRDLKSLLCEICVKNNISFKRPFNTVEDLKNLLHEHGVEFLTIIKEYELEKH